MSKQAQKKKSVKNQFFILINKMWFSIALLILFVLTLSVLSIYLDSAKPFEWLIRAYELWEPSLLGNVLGVLAQIIGFIITVLITGIFVVGQYLGDRLPQRVIQPFLWGKKVVVPLTALFLVLVYDITLLFFFNRKDFTPLASTSFVVLSVLIAVPICLYIMFQSIKAMNVQKIIGSLGQKACKAIDTDDLQTLDKVLEDLTATMVFAVERSQMDITSQAFKAFLQVANKWSDELDSHLKVFARQKGIETMDIKSRLVNGYDSAVSMTLRKQDSVIFGTAIRELSNAFVSLDENLADDFKHIYLKALYSLPIQSPSFSNTLAHSVYYISCMAQEKQKTALLDFGFDLMRNMWQESFDDDDVLHAVIFEYNTLLFFTTVSSLESEQDREFRELLQALKKNIIELHMSMGRHMIQNRQETLHGKWLNNHSSIFTSVLKDANIELVSYTLEKTLSILVSSIYHECEYIYRNLPSTVSACLYENGQNIDYKEITKLLLKYRLSGKLESKMLSISSIFTWLYEEAQKNNDIETATKALNIIFMFPIMATAQNSDILRFINTTIKKIIDEKDKRFADIVFSNILKLIERNVDSEDIQTIRILVNFIKKLLETGLISPEVQIKYVEFCKSNISDFTHQQRNTLFQSLNHFVSTAKTPALLQAARDFYNHVAFGAVEKRDEALVQQVSNYLGWLAYKIITADVSIDKKINTLQEVMSTAVVMNVLSRKLELSRPTLIYLGTLFVVLGAVCEVISEVERDNMLNVIIEAVIELNDFGVIHDALYTRTYNSVTGINELKGKGTEPYERFWIDLQLKSSMTQTAAESSIESSPDTENNGN